jgi:hypothetical protein
VNGTFTFTVHGMGSDGSIFQFHSTEHFDVRLDGTRTGLALQRLTGHTKAPCRVVGIGRARRMICLTRS